MIDQNTLTAFANSLGWFDAPFQSSDWSGLSGAESDASSFSSSDSSEGHSGLRILHPTQLEFQDGSLINHAVKLGASWTVYPMAPNYPYTYYPIPSNEAHINLFDRDAKNIATLLALLNPTAKFIITLCHAEQHGQEFTSPMLVEDESCSSSGPVIHILLNDIRFLANGILEARVPVHVHLRKIMPYTSPTAIHDEFDPIDNLCSGGQQISTLGGPTATLGCFLYGNDGHTYGVSCGHLITDKVGGHHKFLLKPSDACNLGSDGIVVSPPCSSIPGRLVSLRTLIDTHTSTYRRYCAISNPTPKSDAARGQINAKLQELRAAYRKLEIISQTPEPKLIIGRVYAAEMGYTSNSKHPGCNITSSISHPQHLKDSVSMVTMPSSTSFPDALHHELVVSDWILFKMEEDRAGSNSSTWTQFSMLSPGMDVMMPTLDDSHWGTVNGKQSYMYNEAASKEWAIYPSKKDVPMAQQGHSGAVLVTEDNKSVVGLVFGGCEGTGYGLASDIRKVVDRMEAATDLHFSLQPLISK